MLHIEKLALRDFPTNKFHPWSSVEGLCAPWSFPLWMFGLQTLCNSLGVWRIIQFTIPVCLLLALMKLPLGVHIWVFIERLKVIPTDVSETLSCLPSSPLSWVHKKRLTHFFLFLQKQLMQLCSAFWLHNAT